MADDTMLEPSRPLFTNRDMGSDAASIFASQRFSNSFAARSERIRLPHFPWVLLPSFVSNTNVMARARY